MAHMNFSARVCLQTGDKIKVIIELINIENED